MYCKHCGNEIADDSRFCNHCGSPVEAVKQPEIPVAPSPVETVFAAEQNVQEPKRASFAEFQWNVAEYPSREVVEKTEEVDFNWNASPDDIPDVPSRQVAAPAVEMPAEPEIKGADLEKAVFGQLEQEKQPEEMSAAERIDKFFTFNKKNEEFQKLINNEYERVKSGNAIQHEMTEADKIAAERFESRPENTSMESFFEREGIVKPYQPKQFESDVLARIEAQENEKEARRLEEEARLAAIEEARAQAEAQKKAEEEAQRQAEAELARIRAEEEAKIKAEEEARIKAQEEAARLEEIAKRKAEEEARAAEEARIKAEEEARLRAEEEARIRAEEEARIKAEAEAKVKAAEEARIKAEADLKAAQEAARIRAQQEARLAAEEEARFKAEQEKREFEAAQAQAALEEKRRRLEEEANEAARQEEIRKALEQTAKMREEEQAKIRAAVAGLRTGVEPVVAPKTDVEEAHQATRNQISEMAKARDAFFAELDSEEDVKLVTGRETMLSSSDEIAKTRVIDKAAIAAGLNEATRVASVKPAPAPESDDDFFNSFDNVEEHPAAPEAPAEKPAAADIDDLLSQFESVNNFDEEAKAEPVQPAAEYIAPTENHGLNDTVIMQPSEAVANAPANDFDSYGNDVQPQPAGFDAQALDDFYAEENKEEEEFLTYNEQKKRDKAQKKLEKKNAKKAKKSGDEETSHADFYEDAHEEHDEEEGGGKIALKIILVILIIILAVEVVGMGIRFIAPQSKAAEFIDNQLNKVIQLVTGDDTEYSVVVAPVRTEAIEDKTDFINSNLDKNVNGNIGTIAYDPNLKYDEERDGEVSDLVLSQPITQVEWGRDEDNYPVYFDEQVVGTMISFEAYRTQYRNEGDETVLGMVKADSDYYKDLKKLKGKKLDGTFEKLEIGEIRQAGSNYYVWVRETVGGKASEKVYMLYPEEEFVLKIGARYQL